MAAARTEWMQQLRRALSAQVGADAADRLVDDWSAGLPESYIARVGASEAAADVRSLDALRRYRKPLAIAVRQRAGATRLVLMHPGCRLELSETMPLLADMGFRVVEEIPHRVGGASEELWVHDFGVRAPGARALTAGVTQRVADAIAAIREGRAESDTLNRLLLTSGLDWRRLAILRAYRRYRQRVGSRFSEAYQNDVISAHPVIVEKLMALFDARFDPGHTGDGRAQAELRQAILSDLDGVASPDDDRMLRNQLAVIDATVRTNAFRDGARSIAFKIRSADVPAMPSPPPLYEIFIQAQDVEGIHMRAGSIARGGIRWSDRMDYRTEVYGLMRAQTTKNAIIPPEGAKGGFYIRNREGGAAAGLDQAYTTYISALLDLTDNIVGGHVVHPDGVRALDGDDPYLVVAADKGTAALSDRANDIAHAYGFWLGDGFASGGSKGYSHKRLGITAAGAWVSLRHHLAELGVDADRDGISVVGIGDMSGDVFGNAMLGSDRLRLLAAFDHRHVFLDPDPDPVSAAAERRRLFEQPGSTWDDYDRARISAGGGVWSRMAKRVVLGDAARAALGVAAYELSPDDLIRAILRAPVDVLFNGGIGTFVKASEEDHRDAGDRANDAIRVDADALRCRVVVEGGNLGLTQRARVEFARRGGCLYADFIDNSAGVVCSDYEVNLKILLGVAVEEGELEPAQRDALLESVTDDVCARVLRTCDEQAIAIRRHAVRSPASMLSYEDLMAALERDGVIERDREALPTADELADRRRDRRGMVLPEVAIVTAHAKRSLAESLLASALPDDPHLERELRDYFPARVVELHGSMLRRHPLRKHLVATLLANRLVNVLGAPFCWRLAGELGADLAGVARAFAIAQAVLEPASRDPAWGVDDGMDWLLEVFIRWYLRHASEANVAATVAEDAPGLRAIAALLPEIGAPAWRQERDAAARELEQHGVPADVARLHAYRRALVHAPDMLAVARVSGRSLREVGHAFFSVGERLPLAWMEQETDRLTVSTRHQRWAVNAICDDVLAARRRLAATALLEDSGASGSLALERFFERRVRDADRLVAFSRMSTAAGDADLADLLLATRQLTALCARPS